MTMRAVRRYELSLGHPRQSLSVEELDDWFGARPHYVCADGLYHYQNKDTGVSFAFAQRIAGDEGTDDALLTLRFSLDYFRPGFFAVEAGIELGQCVADLHLHVVDAATGRRTEPYRAERFIADWQRGNASACRAMLHGDRVVARFLPDLPRSTLQVVWQWNYTRRMRQAQLGADVHVSPLKLIAYGGEIATAQLWSDAIPIVLAVPDYFLIARNTLAPVTGPDLVVVPTLTVMEHVAAFCIRREGAMLLDYSVPPPAVRAFVQGLAATARVSMLTADSVLDRETLEAVQGGQFQSSRS